MWRNPKHISGEQGWATLRLQEIRLEITTLRWTTLFNSCSMNWMTKFYWTTKFLIILIIRNYCQSEQRLYKRLTKYTGRPGESNVTWLNDYTFNNNTRESYTFMQFQFIGKNKHPYIHTHDLHELTTLSNNIVKKFAFLGLPCLDLLPAWTAAHKVGQGEIGPHVTCKLVRTQPGLARSWDETAWERAQTRFII